ncbi:PREDICTED: uncharacterized protein LOC108769467 [Trachymyrmex cornetzi]|uniref:uncharacterized protein LOC108769467 n=1 Tax=Trachymyrmex cornetzi TaxID=471704 RepID=UPI00084F1304|nr:PREDICTED: uncharacterized protein LOC108769467 [Trachymyrmex cornetzi]
MIETLAQQRETRILKRARNSKYEKVRIQYAHATDGNTREIYSARNIREKSEAQVRLKRLEETFSRFEIIQDEIDEIKEIEDEEGEDAESEMERKQFEERYYKAAATAQAESCTEQQWNS